MFELRLERQTAQRLHRDMAVSRDGAWGETFLSFSTSDESRVVSSENKSSNQGPLVMQG